MGTELVANCVFEFGLFTVVFVVLGLVEVVCVCCYIGVVVLLLGLLVCCFGCLGIVNSVGQLCFFGFCGGGLLVIVRSVL